MLANVTLHIAGKLFFTVKIQQDLDDNGVQLL